MAFQRKKPEAIGLKAPLPGFVEPALASSIDKVPSELRVSKFTHPGCLDSHSALSRRYRFRNIARIIFLPLTTLTYSTPLHLTCEQLRGQVTREGR